MQDPQATGPAPAVAVPEMPAGRPQGPASLTLAAALDLRAAAPLKQNLARALAANAPVTLDAHAVQRMSTACIQLLVAFGAGMQAAGQAVTLARPSRPFAEAFEMLGLSPVISQWRIEP